MKQLLLSFLLAMLMSVAANAQNSVYGFYFLSSYDVVYHQIEERIAPLKMEDVRLKHFNGLAIAHELTPENHLGPLIWIFLFDKEADALMNIQVIYFFENKEEISEEVRKNVARVFLSNLFLNATDEVSGPRIKYENGEKKTIYECDRFELSYDYDCISVFFKRPKGIYTTEYINNLRRVTEKYGTPKASNKETNDNLSVVPQPKRELIPSKKENKYGYVDENGKIVIPYQWKYANKFREGLASVSNDQNYWGYINKEGQVVIPCKWKSAGSFYDGLAPVTNNQSLYGFINKEGQIVIPCKWKSANYFIEGLSSVRNVQGMFGFMNKEGQVVIPCKWESSGDFKNGLALVKNRQGYWGFINKEGIEVIPIKWKYARSFYFGLALVKDNNDLYGFINNEGQVVIPCKWKYAESFEDELALVKDNNDLYGFINKKGQVVIPCKWKYAHNFKNGIAHVQNNEGKWAEINKEGQLVTSFRDKL